MRTEEARTILGLRRGFTRKEAKSAYWCLARKFHPDCGLEGRDDEKMKAINIAYEEIEKSLSNPHHPGKSVDLFSLFIEIWALNLKIFVSFFNSFLDN